jgi:N-acetyl sugar amidotransferase
MDMINYPKPIDLSLFKQDSKKTSPRFGLPEEITFCKSCVISNQRPNSAVEYQHKSDTKKTTINFNDEGICDACRFTAQKNQGIDWQEREKMLVELCDKHRKNDGSYDCLVPGSGGKDSFYASHILKTKYGMHPLTVTWAPHIYTDWGWKNFQAWIHAGHDNYLMTPNGKVHRLLTRLSTEILFHPFQAFFLGQKTIAPKLALQFGIPLIFYGENEAEYGNSIETNNTPIQNKKYFSSKKTEDLMISGLSVDALQTNFGLEPNDLAPYLPAPEDQLASGKVTSHYLGYYLKWHPQSCYYYAVEHGGFEASPERTPGTYSKYNSIDDRIDDLHYYTTGIKFGIGRATYDAAQEIRSGDISRDEGVALVKRFDHEYPERFETEIFEYLSIPEVDFPVASRNFEEPIMNKKYFRDLTDQFRSPHIWFHDGEHWCLRHAVWKSEG